MANRIPLPALISSFIRSKMITLASTAIPKVSTIPAIPGNVKTAPKEDNTPIKKNTLVTNAILATNPAPL